MGLDQYAFKVRKSAVIDDLNFEKKMDGEETYSEIFYWRKVPNLQGWMENLYRKKGGEEVFNCEYVRLDMGDLKQLKRDVINGELPETEGFFFGRHYEEDMPSVLKFIEIAKDAIENGDAVYYSSWW